MLNIITIQKALQERESGMIPNFSNIILNNAVDLIIFDGYSLEQLASMTEDQIETLANDEEMGTEIESEYVCPVCGEKMVIDFTDCESDSACEIDYCKCNHCKAEKKFYNYDC